MIVSSQYVFGNPVSVNLLVGGMWVDLLITMPAVV
jgi:hypothetical protein